jgi:glycosyltransferase involved in cell wall biosynthesis
VHPVLITRLAAVFRRWRPDVVHTHDQRALFYAGPAARLARVPWLVHTRHGRDVNATRRQAAIFRQLSKLVDRFVCVSNEVAALSLAQGVPRAKVRTILNGIDLGRIQPSRPNPVGPCVTVARLSPEKDIANLVRATAIAASRVPDLRVEVAGDGSCREELAQMSVELGVADRIAFLGEVREIAALLGRARLFVLPSRSEGIPLTALEAMAGALPVVATRVGGLPEVVEDGVTGLLVPPSDPQALAGALVEIWDDPGRADRMGVLGRERVEACFDVVRMLAEYSALYDQGVRKSRRPKHAFGFS